MRIAMVVMICSCSPLAECIPEPPVICTEQFVYGVNVMITSTTTQDPISGATLTLTEGNDVEVMEEIMDGGYVGAGERSGTYSLVVEADGFEIVMMDDVVVTADECHVIPVSLTIEMDPL